MKIIYFSATGNSLYVSKFIGREFNAELIPMIKAPVSVKDDMIGFVYPVYCGDIPSAVKDYLTKAEIVSDYIFCISVSGGSPVRANSSVKEILDRKGLKLSYYGNVTSGDNCIVFGAKDFKDVNKKAEQSILKIIDDLKKKTVSEPLKNLNIFKPYVKAMWFFFKKYYKIDKRTIDYNKCIRCGSCAQICPMNNIDIKDGKIDFKGNCAYCFGCIHICPVHAVSFGKLAVNDKTAYLNPDIKKEELLNIKK